MTRKEILQKYVIGDNNFNKANLSGANLRSFNLSEANLEKANLRKADLSGAILRKANLDEANLSEANLCRASLRVANLSKADLSAANLTAVDLSGANLCGANLRGANLCMADLNRANLDGTALSPENKLEIIQDEDFIEAGFEIDGEYAIGWRTKCSQYCGSTKYIVGVKYIAPWFSTDKCTECHPGIYFSSLAWLLNWRQHNCPDISLVKVKARKDQIIHVSDKWRAKEIIVIADAAIHPAMINISRFSG